MGGVVADHYVEPYQSQLAEVLQTTWMGSRKLTSEKEPHGAAYRLGKMTKKEFWDEVKRQSNTEFDADIAHDLWVKTYMPNLAMISILRYLKEIKGIQTGLALNEDRDRWEFIHQAFHTDDFSSINILSYQIDVLKPDKEFYNTVLKATHRENDPSKAMYVDDRQTHVDGALAVGMQGYLFKNPGDFTTSLAGFDLMPFSK